MNSIFLQVYPEPNLMPFFYTYSLCTILTIVSLWVIFRKAGKQGWEAIIPFYNLYVLLKIVGKPGWWLILMLIPLVNFIYLIWASNMLSKSFGKDSGFTVGLLLLGFVFYPILAFGNATYQGPYGDKAAFDAFQGKDKFEFEKQ